MTAQVSDALDVLADALADRIARRLLSSEQPGWIDQAGSPLGPRRHRAAVKRRVAAGEPGAAKVGRRHLLSQEALTEELATTSKRRKSKAKPSLEDEIRSELRLVGGGK